MRRTFLTAVLVAVAALAVMSANASAEYDALQGRFLQRDSADYATSSTNSYEAMQSNPLKHADPTGHMAEDTLGAVGFGGYMYSLDAMAGAGVKALAELVAGAATARNLMMSLAICTFELLQTNPGVTSATWSETANAVRNELARFASNSSDKPEAFREGFRDALNGNSAGNPDDPNKDWTQFAKTLQNGGNKITDATAKALGYPRHVIGDAIEALKDDLQIPSDFHGRILDNGMLVDDAGQFVAWITDYID